MQYSDGVEKILEMYQPKMVIKQSVCVCCAVGEGRRRERG